MNTTSSNPPNQGTTVNPPMSSNRPSGSHGQQLPDKDADSIVLDYLRRKGYKNAEAMFKNDQKVFQKVEDFNQQLESESEVEAPANSNIILHYNKHENATSFKESYSALREWIFSTLDIYRQELIAILYPVFVHCYLDMVQRGYLDDSKLFMEHFKVDHEELHSDDIIRISSVTLPEHMKENELVRFLRTSSYNNSSTSSSANSVTNKFSVKLSRFSFELLTSYLQEKKFMLILSILNQYINIKVFNGQPTAVLPEDQINTGKTEKDINNINKKELYVGLFDDQLPKSKKEPEKSAATSTANTTTAPKPKSQIIFPKMTDQMELEYLDDIKKRASLTSTSFPSICFYTIFHSHFSLNTMDISSDSSKVAGGFSDSSIRIWNMKNKNRKNQNIKKESGVSSNNNETFEHDPDYTLMLGHSGPVYGTNFSPDGQFLLSTSEDKTARLWNVDTGSNLVVYKGHNYPIWDVDFSSLGFLFATASHDRTARLWTTDKIYPLRIFAGHLSDVNCVKFHPNCNYIATGSTDKSLRLWDIQTGTAVRIFTGGHLDSVNTLAISPNGKYMASAAEDKKIIIWDLGTSKKISTLVGHEDSIWSLDFSAESNILASGSSDNTVRLWNVNNGTEIGMKRKLESMEDEVESDSLDPLTTTVKQENTNNTSSDLLKTFPTKSTPVFKVKFTKQNLLLASGPFQKKE